MAITKDRQYYKFCFYGFLKNLRFFEAFFILFLKQSGLSYTEIGSLYALREIITNLSEVPTGIIADTYGRKKSLAFSFIAYILSFGLFFYGKDYPWFLAAFLLYGIADAFRSGTHKAMIMDYLKIKGWNEQKIDYYGHTRACSQRGSALSALIAGIIVFYTGNYRNIFLISIIPYLLNLLLILSYPATIDQHTQSKHRSIFKSIRDLWQAVKSPKVLTIIHSAAVFTAYQKAVKDYIQPVMKQVVLSLPLLLSFQAGQRVGLGVGILYFFLYLLTSNASKKAGKIVKKVPSIASFSLLGGLLLGIAGGYFYQLAYWKISLLAFAGIYVVESLRKPVLTGYLSDAVPNEILASVLSAQSLYRSLLTSVLALGFGYLADKQNVGFALLSISLILLLLSIPLEYKAFKKM